MSTSQRQVTIDYTNWRGERAMRVIVPNAIWFGSSEWHPERQWLLRAYDVGKRAHRDFAMSMIHGWTASEPRSDEAPDNCPT